MHDPIADLLTRIRNAQMAHLNQVSMPSSKLKSAICKVLEAEGYINRHSVTKGVKPVLMVDLKYHKGHPVIELIDRVSRPGLRIYRDTEGLPRVRGGLGIAIISTNKGLMTDRRARREQLGGEVLCTVF